MKQFISLVIIFIVLVSCKGEVKSITFHDAKYGYAETVVIKEADKITIHVSGQIGAGETLEEQMRNALSNLQKQLKKHGANYNDLVKINTYIVNYKAEDLTIFREVRSEIFGEKNVPASTLVGVQSLALPEWKIEIDAIAIQLH